MAEATDAALLKGQLYYPSEMALAGCPNFTILLIAEGEVATRSTWDAKREREEKEN